MASGDSSSKSEEKDSGPTGEGKSEGDVDFKDLEDYLTREAHEGDEALRFISKYSLKFVGIDPEATFPVELYTIFEEYKEIYERKLEQYLEDHGVTSREFVSACKRSLRGPVEADGGHREFIRILLASMEFEAFTQLMKAAAPKFAELGRYDVSGELVGS